MPSKNDHTDLTGNRSTPYVSPGLLRSNLHLDSVATIPLLERKQNLGHSMPLIVTDWEHSMSDIKVPTCGIGALITGSSTLMHSHNLSLIRSLRGPATIENVGRTATESCLREKGTYLKGIESYGERSVHSKGHVLVCHLAVASTRKAWVKAITQIGSFADKFEKAHPILLQS